MTDSIQSKSLEQTIAAIHALDLTPIKFKATRKEDGYGWSAGYADQMEVAYKRYLILHAKHPELTLAPEQDVDRFWHMHILDTRKYAADCEATFGYFLHHFPYLGLRGEEDAKALDAAFERMQSLIAQEFGAQQHPEGAMQASAWCTVEGKAAWCTVESPQAKAAWCTVESQSAAWCTVETTKAAWCTVETTPAKAAWCTVESTPAKAAWCTVESTPAKAAWCTVESTPAKAAWCTVESTPAKAAWCTVESTPAKAAWCTVESTPVKAAWCTVESTPAKAAWCTVETTAVKA